MCTEVKNRNGRFTATNSVTVCEDSTVTVTSSS